MLLRQHSAALLSILTSQVHWSGHRADRPGLHGNTHTLILRIETFVPH